MSIILRIIVKEDEENPGFTDKYKGELVDYLNNSMRHIADDWEISVINPDTHRSE